MIIYYIIISIAIIIILIDFYFIYYYRSVITDLDNKLSKSTEDYVKLLSQKKSSEVRLGQIAEQLAPFTEHFPYDPKSAHFIGQPIDYVVFEPERVVFVEVKSGQSKLSTSQRNIKQLIDDGKVEFHQVIVK